MPPAEGRTGEFPGFVAGAAAQNAQAAFLRDRRKAACAFCAAAPATNPGNSPVRPSAGGIRRRTKSITWASGWPGARAPIDAVFSIATTRQDALPAFRQVHPHDLLV